MDIMLYDYEMSLISDTKLGSGDFYDKTNKYSNQNKALICIRYAIENVLKWNVDEAIQKFDKYIIRVMKLEDVLNYIQWPDEIIKGDPKYILSLLYPERVKINMQKKTEELLVSILNSNHKQFPREFFTGTIGFYRYCACIKYLINNFKWFESAEEVYEYFLSPEGDEFLEKYKLKTPGVQLDINILNVLNVLLKGVENNDLFYSYYSFQKKYELISKQN